jgi:hypothetical protein
MDDHELVQRINGLAEEEHRLERAEGAEGLTDEERDRRREIEVALDQCWDLLRQRRARRDAGLDPEDVAVRPPGVVEGYQQ